MRPVSPSSNSTVIRSSFSSISELPVFFCFGGGGGGGWVVKTHCNICLLICLTIRTVKLYCFLLFAALMLTEITVLTKDRTQTSYVPITIWLFKVINSAALYTEGSIKIFYICLCCQPQSNSQRKRVMKCLRAVAVPLTTVPG